MAFPDHTKAYPTTLTNLGSTFSGTAEGERVVVVFEKGAVDDIEKLRAVIMSSSPMIEINPGFRFEIHRGTPRHVIMQKGAVDDLAAVRAELKKLVALIEINTGFRFELLYA